MPAWTPDEAREKGRKGGHERQRRLAEQREEKKRAGLQRHAERRAVELAEAIIEGHEPTEDELDGLVDVHEEIRKLLGGKDLSELHTAKAVKVLIKMMDSDDERLAQQAAIKVLEYTKGKPATQEQEEHDRRIVFETAFVPPAHVAETLDLDSLPPPPGIE